MKIYLFKSLRIEKTSKNEFYSLRLSAANRGYFISLRFMSPELRQMTHYDVLVKFRKEQNLNFQNALNFFPHMNSGLKFFGVNLGS